MRQTRRNADARWASAFLCRGLRLARDCLFLAARLAATGLSFTELDQRWCRLPAPIGLHRVSEKGKQMLLLLRTGGADSQDALNKAVALGAVCAKTAFAPQHRHWRGSPIFRRNPRRWRARVHGASMPGVSTAVKSVQCVGHAAVP